jgi:hypothetical protein
MNSISIKDLLVVYEAIATAMDSMDASLSEKRGAWHQLNTARNIIRVAIERTEAKVEIAA